MKLQRFFLFFFIIVFYIGCASKKTTIEYKDKIVKDTIYKTEIKTVLKPIKDTLLIKEPCDSLGNLKDFERVIKNDKAKVIIKNEKGNLKVNIDIDSIVNSKVNEFKSSFKKDVQIKEVEVIRYKIPFWFLVALAVSALLNVVLLKLNKFV